MNKDKEDKLRLDLIPQEFLVALAKLYAHGGGREERDWENGKYTAMELLGATKRHMIKYELGSNIDDKTNAHHLIAALWNLIAIYTYEIRGKLEDDRPYKHPPLEIERWLYVHKQK